MAPTIGQAT